MSQSSRFVFLSLLLATTLLFINACDDENGGDLCTTNCNIGQLCVEDQGETNFDMDACLESCQDALDTYAEFGCDDEYITGFNCVYDQVDESDFCETDGEVFTAAMEACSDEEDAFVACMDDDSDGDGTDATERMACKEMCDRMWECDTSGSLDESWNTSCRMACEEADEIATDLFVCLDVADCAGFQDCLNGMNE